MTQLIKQRCLGCSNYLTDPVSRQLRRGPKCYLDHFGVPQPRPSKPRPARPTRHRGRDVVEVDLLAAAAELADQTEQVEP